MSHPGGGCRGYGRVARGGPQGRMASPLPVGKNVGVRPFVAVALLSGLTACAPAVATLSDDLPADLREVIEEALDEIAVVMAAHPDCLTGVEVRHAWELEDRAQYLPDEAAVVLRVPSTALYLTFSLAHEIAHHLEFACPAQADMRPAFLAAQGFEPGTAWFTGRSWEETPSEQFATAIAILVTGQNDPQRPFRISDEALVVVEEWGRGGS